MHAETCNIIKKEILAQVFPCEFSEISNNTFLTENLWVTATVNIKAYFLYLNFYSNVDKKLIYCLHFFRDSSQLISYSNRLRSFLLIVDPFH